MSELWRCLRGHGIFDRDKLASRRGLLECPMCLFEGAIVGTLALVRNETFPITGSSRIPCIPYALIQPCGRRIILNFGQGITDILRRGGLSAREAVAVLTDKPFVMLDQQEAETELARLVAVYQAARVPQTAEAR